MMRVFIVSEPTQIDTMKHTRTHLHGHPKQVDDAFINIYDKWKVAIRYGPSAWMDGWSGDGTSSGCHVLYFALCKWQGYIRSGGRAVDGEDALSVARVSADSDWVHLSLLIRMSSTVGTYLLLQCYLPSDKWTDLYSPSDSSKQCCSTSQRYWSGTMTCRTVYKTNSSSIIFTFAMTDRILNSYLSLNRF